MNYQQFASQITAAKDLIAEQIPKAKTPDEAQFAGLMVLGLEIFGEVFLDIKRIADASEKLGGLA